MEGDGVHGKWYQIAGTDQNELGDGSFESSADWGRGIAFPGGPDMTRIRMRWLGVHRSGKSAVFRLSAVEN